MITQQETYALSIKYDEESTRDGLIKITPNEGVTEVVIKADMLLDLIANHLNKKELALALTDNEVKDIYMLMVARRINFLAAKDYKVGEIVETVVEHPYPAVLLALEKAYDQYKESVMYTVPKDKVMEQIQNLAKNNEEFVQHLQNILKSTDNTPKEEAVVESPLSVEGGKLTNLN